MSSTHKISLRVLLKGLLQWSSSHLWNPRYYGVSCHQATLLLISSISNNFYFGRILSVVECTSAVSATTMLFRTSYSFGRTVSVEGTTAVSATTMLFPSFLSCLTMTLSGISISAHLCDDSTQILWMLSTAFLKNLKNPTLQISYIRFSLDVSP